MKNLSIAAEVVRWIATSKAVDIEYNSVTKIFV